MIKRIIDRIKSKPMVALILLELIVLLCVMVCPRLASRTEYSFGTAELSGNKTSELTLKKGSYSIEIEYTSADSNGFMHFVNNYSAENDKESGIRCDSNQLFDLNRTHLSTQIWAIKDIEQFQFYVDETYTGQVLFLSVKRNYGDVNKTAVLLIALFAVLDYMAFCFLKVKEGKEEYVAKNKTFLVLLTTTALLSLPLMIDYLLDGHDLQFHLVRIEGLKQAIQDGQFPNRIDMFAINGQGYADPIFYPYLFLYFPAILRCLDIAVLDAYKMFVAVVIFAGVTISYFSFKGILKNRKAALVGMFLFNVAPYHLANLYSRAAVGENLAYSFIPLVAWGAVLLLSDEIDGEKLKKGSILLICGFTGIIQSHILSCEMVGVFLLFGILMCLRRLCRIKTFLSFAVAGIITVLINLWFILPFVQSFGMDYRVFNVYSTLPHDHSLVFYQILGARQVLYGSSVPTEGGIAGEMGVSIGLALPIGIVVLLYEAFNIYRRREESRKVLQLMCPFAILAVIALWMTSDIFPWMFVEKLPVIGNLFTMVQFPWRNLGIATFCVSVPVAVLFTFDYDKEKFKIYEAVVLFAAVILCLSNFESLISHNGKYEPYYNFSSNTLGNEEFIYGIATKEQLYNGLANADMNYEKRGKKFVYQVENLSEEPVEVNTHLSYYPYYVAKEADSNERLALRQNDAGCLTFSVPSGLCGEVYVYVPESKKWLLGDFVSLITVLLLVFTAMNGFRRKKLEENN